jgi:tetratricopeptide (TPR) repeat protein
MRAGGGVGGGLGGPGGAGFGASAFDRGGANLGAGNFRNEGLNTGAARFDRQDFGRNNSFNTPAHLPTFSEPTNRGLSNYTPSFGPGSKNWTPGAGNKLSTTGAGNRLPDGGKNIADKNIANRVNNLPAHGGAGIQQLPANIRTGDWHNNWGFHNNNYVNRSNYYGNWYHGNWTNHNHPWYGYGYYRPWGWGYGWGLATGLALTAMAPWSWGYYSYSNPYYAPAYYQSTPYINYGQPIVATPPVDPAQASGPSQQALVLFNQARDSFMQGQYQQALAQTNQALQLTPDDPVMHEFRALCLFALKDYKDSAAALYAVLSAGPGWDWTTMSSLYPDIDVYTQQLRALEDYSAANPNSAEAHFLRAYCYNDAAARQLQAVVKLQPNDQLATQLLASLTQKPIDDTTPPPQPAPPAVAGQPVDAAALVGSWSASRPDGTKFELKLSKDDQFSWGFTNQGKTQQMTGKYTLADDYLILKASDENSLIGQVAMQDGKLRFKLAGDNPADPGLLFTR